MIKFRLISNNNFLEIYDYDDIRDVKQIKSSLTKHATNYRFNPKFKKGWWDGKIEQMVKDKYIPSGLWSKVKQICETYDIKYEMPHISNFIDTEFNEEEFRAFVDEVFKDSKYTPYDYQLHAAINILKYKKSISEIATSAGKTLLLYIIFRWLQHKGAGQMLIVVPNTSLVLQTIDEFRYEFPKFEFSHALVTEGAKLRDHSVNLIIGNYQSLIKLEENDFRNVQIVAVDECHTAAAASIKKIIQHTLRFNPSYRFGISGTTLQNKKGDLVEDTAESLTLQAYLGPLVTEISTKFLQDNGYATKAKITVVKLKYLPEDIRKKISELRKKVDKEKTVELLKLEYDLVVENKLRFDYIVKSIAPVTKNSLVLFRDVKGSYGKRLHAALREKSNCEVFYIDGSVSQSIRETIISEMKEGTGKILVASFGTLSTGISIKNIHSIFFTESYKSEIVIRQSIGRGIRLYEGKDVIRIFDFVDDFSYKNSDNFLLRHGKERIKIYEEQQFPWKLVEVDLLK